MSDLEPTRDEPMVQGRKRVVAREVEAENVDATALTPQVIEPVAAVVPAQEPPLVVDPALLGGRRRRSDHQRVYRATQLCTVVCSLLALLAIFFTLGDEVGIAAGLAGGGILLGITAVILSGRNALAGRWRGWAIAASVFCGAVLLLTAIHHNVTQ